MNPRNLVPFIVSFLAYLLLQVFFVRQVVLFQFFFCYVYIACVLLLPFDTSRIVLLLVGFFTGFFVDLFYDTLGMHAAATTLLAFLRPNVVRLLMPQRGYEERMSLSLNSMGLQWFASYVVLLALAHHALLFLLEASSWSLLGYSLLKILASTLFTTLVLIILQYFRGED